MLYITETNGELFFPIASVSKTFTGFTTTLFALDEKNKKFFDGTVDCLNVSIEQLLTKKRAELEKISKNDRTELENTKLNKINTILSTITTEGLEKSSDAYEKRKAFANITIAQLLTHTSCLIENEQMKKVKEIFSEKQTETKVNTKTKNMATITKQDLIDDDKKMLADFTPSLVDGLTLEHKENVPNYSNTGFMLLGDIVALISDKETFYEVEKEYLLQPIGISNEVKPFYEVDDENKRKTFIISEATDLEDWNVFSPKPNNIPELSVVGAGELCATKKGLDTFGKFIGDVIVKGEVDNFDVTVNGQVKNLDAQKIQDIYNKNLSKEFEDPKKDPNKAGIKYSLGLMEKDLKGGGEKNLARG